MAKDTLNGGTRGKLVGGSKGPPLGICQQCGAEEPPHRCAGCASVAYCSRQCQQKHWMQGHKNDCKKLRKAKQHAEKLGAIVAGGSEQANGHSEAVAGGMGSSSAERPEESNNLPPVPKQVLYPSERYAELAAFPPTRKQPLGLQNVGNSCYANSLLQALLATPSFAAYLVSGEHSRGCLKSSLGDWCVLCELENLARQAYCYDGHGSVLNPRPLLCNVKRLGKQFSFGRQEDSHELYLRLMEAVEAVQLLEAGGKAQYDLRSRETTLIHHVFAGYTRNQIECRACGHVSRTYECCTSLTLEVSPRIISLEAALQNFTAVERLDGDNRYKCDGCKAYVAADKSTRLEVAPHVLQICLKRFGPGRFGKITTRLSFPEQLELGPYMAGGCMDGEPMEYSLYAVVVHIDVQRSTDYGHYIAYVKCGGSWFKCDDSTVTPAPAAKALASGAYLLFYQRQAPRWIVAATKQSASKADVAATAAEVLAAAKGAAAAERTNSSSNGVQAEATGAALPHLGMAEAAAQASQVGAAPSSPLHAATSLDRSVQVAAQQCTEVQAGAPAANVSGSLRSIQHAASAPAGGLTEPAAVKQSDSVSSRPASQQQQRDEFEQGLEVTAEAAAAAARAEVEALVREQVGEQSSSAASSQPSSPQLAASANPFILLSAEGDASEAESDSESGASIDKNQQAGSKQPAVAANACATFAASQVRQGQQQQAELVAGCTACRAAKPLQQPVAGANTAAEAAQPRASQQPGCVVEKQHMQEQQRSDATVTVLAPVVGANKLEGSAAAKQPLAQAAAPSADEHPSSSRDSQLQGEASTMEHPTARQRSSREQPTSNCEGACTPKHRASVLLSDNQRSLRLSVELPGVQGEAQVDWTLSTGGGGSSLGQQLLLRAEQYALRLPLPVPVAADAVATKWVAAQQKLVATWPVLS